MFTIENDADRACVLAELRVWQQAQRELMLKLDVQREIKEQTGRANDEAIQEFERGIETCQVAIRHLGTIIGAARAASNGVTERA